MLKKGFQKEISQMASQPQNLVQDHISNILSRSLPERCALLNRSLQETSHKDLYNLYSYIVEDIFGFGANHGRGWGLMEMARSRNVSNFMAVMEFLSPRGPLITTAYKLLGNGRSQYEFPIYCLPPNTQSLLEEGNIPALYNHKIPYSGPGRVASHITLNPFEFYFFHFAYLIVNPAYSKGAIFPTTMSESLYPCLLDQYFNYFLTLDNTSIPLASSYGYSNSTISVYGQYSDHSPSNQGNLLNKSFLPSLYPTGKRNYTDINLYSVESSSNGLSNSEFLQDEIWRSQTLIFILAEFWLNLSSDDSPNIIFNPIVQLNLALEESFVPSHCQMQLVRHFVKYLHSFTNSAIQSDEKIPNLSFEASNPWNEFKKNIVSQCIQKKLYTYLKLSFLRWPLDSTFRLPLETWLSYIQPWRYEKSDKDLEQGSEPVDSKWEMFIAENLLFYSVIFQKVLPCFFRLDLINPRQSYLLFRVAKVFSLPNLRQMILEVENQLQEPSLTQLNSSILLQSSISNSNNIHSQVRQKIYELEGLGYNYEPMFGAKVRSQVLKLLTMICEAKINVTSKVREINQVHKSWWSLCMDFFSSSEYETRDISLPDLRKVDAHLNSSATQLCSMFKLSMPTIEESVLQRQSQSIRDSDARTYCTFPRVPKERISYHNVKYQGNPDIQPIRTFEVAFLVRLLYHLSTLINEKYSTEQIMLYNRTDFTGKMARQILAEPVVCRKNDHDESLVTLPPRVNLRILAHRQLLLYLSVFYTLFLCLGYGSLHFIALIIFIFVSFVTVRALFSSN